MKKLLFLGWSILISGALLAQNKMSCCSKSDATQDFAVFAADKNFMATHENPIPFTFHSDNGKDVEFKTDDGTSGHAWEIKAAKTTPYWIVVVHEWWGLNDYIKKESERMWNDFGVNVLAIDLYDKKIATNQQEASQAMQSVKTERAVAIIKGALAHLGKDAKVFTIGWCFGGGWSLQASLLAGMQAAGCIMYYGMPEKDIDKLKTLNCDVLGIFGTQDGYITPQVVNDFSENMKKAGKKITVHSYDAVHAFANPSNPKYDKVSADDAYKYVTAFIKERIK